MTDRQTGTDRQREEEEEAEEEEEEEEKKEGAQWEQAGCYDSWKCVAIVRDDYFGHAACD